jgi:cobalamin synthase
VIFGGLLAISVVILQRLIALNSLDTPALIALISLSLSIPVLAAMIIVNLYELSVDPSSSDKETINLHVLYWGGILNTITGITAEFWYASWIGAIVFVSSSVIAGIVCAVFLGSHFFSSQPTTPITQPTGKQAR